jgi:hypothetical protein
MHWSCSDQEQLRSRQRAWRLAEIRRRLGITQAEVQQPAM